MSDSKLGRAPWLALVSTFLLSGLTAGVVPGVASAVGVSDEAPMTAEAPSNAADRLLAGLAPPLRALAEDVLRHSPEVDRARAEANAAAARARQMGSWPDPSAMLTLFALPPETRVGPQRVAVSVSQPLPWLDKLDLREREALWAGVAAEARWQAQRLARVTMVRKQFYELAFVTEQAAIVDREHEHLLRHEELARARYATGHGLQQGVIKIQAEITRSEQQRLQVEARWATLVAELNALRQRPTDTVVMGLALPATSCADATTEALVEQAWAARPERRVLDAELERRRSQVELARLGYRPDFTVGLGYTVVERRQDDAGRANPPQGNGDDVFALTAGVRWPVHRQRVAAELEEALALTTAAEADQRRLRQDLERSIGSLTARLPLLGDQLRLFDQVLLAQAREAVSSAETAYSTGALGALDLLDAEHVLFDVELGAVRTRLEIAQTCADLEGAVGQSLTASASAPPGAEASERATRRSPLQRMSEGSREAGSSEPVLPNPTPVSAPPMPSVGATGGSPVPPTSPSYPISSEVPHGTR